MNSETYLEKLRMYHKFEINIISVVRNYSK